MLESEMIKIFDENKNEIKAEGFQLNKNEERKPLKQFVNKDKFGPH